MIFILGLPGGTLFTVVETIDSLEKLPFENKNLLLQIGLPGIFLDLICGTRGVPGSLGKCPNPFREVGALLDKDQISREELAK